MNVHFILRDQLWIKPTIDAALLGVLISIGLVFVGECRGGFEILHTAFCHKVKLASDSPLAKLSWKTLLQVNWNDLFSQLFFLWIDANKVNDLLRQTNSFHCLTVIGKPSFFNAVMDCCTHSTCQHVTEIYQAHSLWDAGRQHDLSQWLQECCGTDSVWVCGIVVVVRRQEDCKCQRHFWDICITCRHGISRWFMSNRYSLVWGIQLKPTGQCVPCFFNVFVSRLAASTNSREKNLFTGVVQTTWRVCELK